MAEAPLLVELLTEELPPKALRAMAEQLREALVAELRADGFVAEPAEARAFATPRRLAVLVAAVRAIAPEQTVELRGPAIGAPAQAVEGFARRHGVAPEALVRVETDKGAVHAVRRRVAGAALEAVLERKLARALAQLPVPKRMRWGEGEESFVRPVHGLVMLHGARVVPGRIFGLASSNRTRGHRFLGAAEIALASADEYERRLLEEGRVIASFDARRREIEAQLAAAAARLGATLGDCDALVEEVAALVEYPTVYVGAFDPRYLEVPAECLVLTMRQHQKYFPLFDAAGKLLPRFLIVSNMRVPDPRHIVAGNERVVRPRLEDARFFFEQDRRVRLEARVPQLARVVYHRRLGTQLERVERLQLLSGHIARALGADVAAAERAAWLAKADLLTGMVGEFPELQGVMGRYYARHDGEPEAVCEAIGAQYLPRFPALAHARDRVSACLYLAERLDALVGLFGIGEAPTGEKDPFGLRRAAFGVISVYELLGEAHALDRARAPDLGALLAHAASLFPPGTLAPEAPAAVHDFVFERYRHHLAARHAKDCIDAVISRRPPLDEVLARVRALEAFRADPAAESLAAANKRIRNILRKSAAASGALDERLLAEPAERALFEAMRRTEPQVAQRSARRDFAGTLEALAALRAPVDAFFDSVRVNAEDAGTRANRHALLRRLDALLNEVADISRLAA
ncbi:MAG: glycine--tRNA ligase subunit beta [Burkholderiales bacterium]|nr:glycine--tRNA ligase subunit beta [Burkholderiales bacterium]